MALVPLALRQPPLEVLARLAGEPDAVLLEVPDPERPAVLLGCRPVAELRIAASTADPLAAVAAFVAATPPSPPDVPFPLGGGVIAALAYELGHATVGARLPAPRASAEPLAVLRRYDPLVVLDVARGQYHLLASEHAALCAAWLERLAAPATVPPTGPLAHAPLAARRLRADYLAAVARIHEYLRAGDVYQVNLTQPFATPLAAPAWVLYQRLATEHPAPYGAYLDLGDRQIVANSPELLLRRRGARIETRPIKGTRPRGADPARDVALAAELARDPKERAEHVMIVDLERNDLGRVCAFGSVAVEGFARVETHPTVHHLVSTVTGRLRDDVGLAELLAATFPGGSITGAPKRRAMEVIAELEPWPRSFYTGALGLIDPRGDLELGLPIRTAIVRDGVVWWHAGGGIVVDSDAERELAEAWLKTAALRLALGGDLRTGGQCSSG
ncbi:MAG: aminodeoxychorismate synthase component I [Candidatus Binatia bacterium]